MKKILLVPVLCLALSLLLTGCSKNSAGNAVSNAASKAGELVSKAGEGLSEAGSRLESMLDGDDGLSSTVSGVESVPDDDVSSGLVSDGDLVSGVSGASSDLS